MSNNELTPKNGVSHIDKLSIDNFLMVIEDFINDTKCNAKITEKLDGSAIAFGKDENNKFYTTRANKSSDKFYSADDWYDKSWTNSFKSAHKVLEQFAKDLPPNTYQEGEILYSILPNVVPYNTNEINKIVMFGDYFEPFATEIDATIIYSDDGINIKRKVEHQKWEILSNPVIEWSAFHTSPQKEKIKPIIDEIKCIINKEFLTYNNITLFNRDAMTVPLNFRPEYIPANEWKNIKRLIKEKREELGDVIQGLKNKIKSLLVDFFISNKSSYFQHEKTSFIEGVVVEMNGCIFKIVDKETFTASKELVWMYRNRLSGGSSYTDDLYGKQGLKYLMDIDIQNAANLDKRPTLTWCQSQGDSTDERITNIAAMIDYKSLKESWYNILTTANNTLDIYYNDMMENHEEFFYNIYKCKLCTQELKKRTITAYADMRELLTTMKYTLNECINSNELVVWWLGEKL